MMKPVKFDGKKDLASSPIIVQTMNIMDEQGAKLASDLRRSPEDELIRIYGRIIAALDAAKSKSANRQIK